MACFCDHGDKTLGSRKEGNFWIFRATTYCSRKSLHRELECVSF
jgi:hypothetical protein